MNRRTLTASVLASAVALATAAAATSTAMAQLSPEMQKKLDTMLKMYPGASKTAIEQNMRRAVTQKLQPCYGINAVAKNDCAAGVHSCAGQATQARDPNSFVLLPAGDCGKVAGGSLKPAKS